MKLGFLHWMIAILVVANIAFFMWPSESAPEQELAAIPGLKQLQLLEPLALEESTPEEELEPEPELEQELEQEPEQESETELESQPGPQPELALEVVAELEEPESCWRLGPLDGAPGRELQALFGSNDVDWQLSEVQVALPPDHWVYLEVGKESAEVGRIRGELLSLGFDNFLITNGELQGRLSLGLFREEARAFQVVSAVAAEGYTAKIYLRRRSRAQFWFELSGTGLIALGWPIQEGPAPGFDALQLEQRECP